MKNLPLSYQIWLVIAAIALTISILISVLLPWTLRDFFTKEIYATIESSQSLIFDIYDNDIPRGNWGIMPHRNNPQLQNARTVNHLVVFYDNNKVVVSQRIPAEFLETITKNIREQEDESHRYSSIINQNKMFYVITNRNSDGENIYLVSYMLEYLPRRFGANLI